VPGILVLKINLDALVHNLNVYKSLLKPGVKIMAMVKAFSYGSGSYEIANVMQFHHVDYLAVAFADEGRELRHAGITIPILVLNPELHNLDVLFRYNLEPEVYSIPLLKRLGVELQRYKGYNQNYPFPVHIKLDTGMHRMGFMPYELVDLITTLKKFPNIHVASVLSHFAASDLPDFDDFTVQQINLFESLCSELEKGLGYSFLKHIANTSAISRFPKAQYDMVRLGIGMYGIDGNSEIESRLQNVTTFRSVISQVKDLPAGETVGYNRAGKLSRDTRLAIVPAGYADGLDRRLGNRKGYVMINGRKAPFVGNISMDMCAVDVTGIDAGPSDEVIIFGTKPSIKELAQQLGTIPYEILTSIPPRVKRIYYQE
jgi:Alr-MurF fusion protein